MPGDNSRPSSPPPSPSKIAPNPLFLSSSSTADVLSVLGRHRTGLGAGSAVRDVSYCRSHRGLLDEDLVSIKCREAG
eukprot:CAMPEP_0177741528 /NCGR_PEP_ID=MMETSP0484_2-20121128/28157_1 /TAXON_ID=354590 /ORGANISM="Rhodomonas lens, Strain RHODO" /LENGTH=76 /DNA_ID=CAMNT_0019255763 /DNA_START=190 /DNA_END=417 /DNA_ORIENTATION=-